MSALTNSPATGRRTSTDVQALRAVAVAAVLVFHAWPDLLPGGLVGVDVFFVISGFLIIGHLASDADEHGRPRLGQFYVRRIARLIPMATLVLLTTALAVWRLMPSLYWETTGRELFASAAYFENWRLLWDSADYAAVDAGASPYQHYWSLSVEEQFYIVIPLLMLLVSLVAGASRRKVMWWLLLAVSVSSFAFGLGYQPETEAAEFYNTFLRVWEFGLGGLLALARVRIGGSTGIALRVGGLALIVASTLWLGRESSVLGALMLVPTLGAAMFLAGSDTGGEARSDVVSRVLAWRPVRTLGDESYGVYLWHWPLMVILPVRFGPEWWVAPVAIVGSVALALLCKPIEDWFRRPRRSGVAKAVTVIGLAVSVALAGVGGRTLVAAAPDTGQGQGQEDGQGGPPGTVAPVPPTQGPCIGAAAFADPRRCGSATGSGAVQPDPRDARRDLPDENCKETLSGSRVVTCTFGTGKTKVALVGDSHAQRLLSAAKIIAPELDWQITTFMKSSCPFSAVPPRKYESSCARWNGEVMNRLRQGGFDVVLTQSASGQTYAGNPGEGDVAAGARGMTEHWKALTQAGMKVIAVRDNPLMGLARIDPPACVLARGVGACSAPQSEALRPDPQVQAAKAVPEADLVDLTNLFCRDGQCPSVIGGVLVYRDGQHVLSAYWRTAAPYLAARIRATTKG